MSIDGLIMNWVKGVVEQNAVLALHDFPFYVAVFFLTSPYDQSHFIHLRSG